MTTEEKILQIEKDSKKYQGLVVDMDNPSERKKVKESASVINDILKKLERARIDKSKDYKAKVEAEAKSIRERLEIANKPLTLLIEDHAEKQRKIREKEKTRQDKIQGAFDSMKDMAMNALGQTSIVIQSIIEELESFDFNRNIFQERTDEAVKEHSELMVKLQRMKEAEEANEEMQRRSDEIERKEREIAEAEEKARVAEERKLIEEEAAAKAKQEANLRIARETEEAEKRAKEREEAAVKTERDRIEREQKEKEEEERIREADKKHKGAIHSEIVKKLVAGGLTEKDAKKAVELIAKGLAGNVRVFY